MENGMDKTVSTPTSIIDNPDFQQAWDLVVSQLRMDMTQGLFETWVLPLIPLDYSDHRFRVGARNPYARDWVDSRLKDRMLRILEGVYNETISLQLEVVNGFYRSNESNPAEAPVLESQTAQKMGTGTMPGGENIDSGKNRKKSNSSQSASETNEPARNRKVMLQRAYGSKRAAIIQPERGMFVTMYFFANWLPLVGHSALTIIMAARSMCFWNPMTGELRNTVETDMTELAARAAVSIRTVKEVLKNELIRNYFLRYRARRMMTPNGIRTAGITLQVRMDDPLTPQDQMEHDLYEEERWYSDEYNDSDED
jgi:hypothetical protein